VSGFAGTIKLGRPTQELSFTGAVDVLDDDLLINFGTVETETENISGETFTRNIRRLQTRFSIRATSISETLKDALVSLRTITDTHLAFIYAGDHKLFSERYVTLDGTTLALKTNSFLLLDRAYAALAGAAQIAIVGAFADYSALGAQVSPNRAGAYDRTNFILQLTGGPWPIGTPFFVNWTYKGALGKIDGAVNAKQSRQFVNGVTAWDVDLRIKGV
jgi:hypothetical protein